MRKTLKIEVFMSKPIKTNAMRMLESAGLSFRVVTYEVDEEDLSGVHAAQTCGLPIEQVFKTLVTKGDFEYLVACIPVEMELDLKKLALVSGNKKVDMKKPFATFFEESAVLYDWIAVSAGMRGAQILIEPQSLIDFVGAGTGDI